MNHQYLVITLSGICALVALCVTIWAIWGRRNVPITDMPNIVQHVDSIEIASKKTVHICLPPKGKGFELLKTRDKMARRGFRVAKVQEVSEASPKFEEHLPKGTPFSIFAAESNRIKPCPSLGDALAKAGGGSIDDVQKYLAFVRAEVTAL